VKPLDQVARAEAHFDHAIWEEMTVRERDRYMMRAATVIATYEVARAEQVLADLEG